MGLKSMLRKSRPDKKALCMQELLPSLSGVGPALQRCMDMDKECCNTCQLAYGIADDQINEKIGTLNPEDERIVAGIGMFLFRLINERGNNRTQSPSGSSSNPFSGSSACYRGTPTHYFPSSLFA